MTIKCSPGGSRPPRICGPERRIGALQCVENRSADRMPRRFPPYYAGACPDIPEPRPCRRDCCCELPCAAQFAACAPQICPSGGALRLEIVNGGGFGMCGGGVRIEKEGLYMMTYVFTAPSGMNAASNLCLVCRGAPVPGSGAYLAPVTGSNCRSAMGQALARLSPGDTVELFTSGAMDIPAGCPGLPVASLVICRIGG